MALQVVGLNLIPVAVGAGIVFLAIFLVLPVRSQLRRRRIRRLPRKNMPIRKRDLASQQYSLVMQELLRTVSLNYRPSEESAVKTGWGRPGTDFDKVHFKKSVSRSHLILERAAVHKNSLWRRKPDQTIRQYIDMLASVCPHMNRISCTRVIQHYENARYGTDELTEDEYRDFMEHFRRMLQALDYE